MRCWPVFSSISGATCSNWSTILLKDNEARTCLTAHFTWRILGKDWAVCIARACLAAAIWSATIGTTTTKMMMTTTMNHVNTSSVPEVVIGKEMNCPGKALRQAAVLANTRSVVFKENMETTPNAFVCIAWPLMTATLTLITNWRPCCTQARQDSWESTSVHKDATEAARYFRAAADKGYHSAVFMIGLMTEEGVGVPQDYTEAAKLYRSIADTHCQAACFRLGRMFELGLGVALNTMEAMRLYDIAANGTVSNATFVEKYSDWKEMSCQALSTLLRAAADQGNAHAQYKLGCMFEKGLYMEPLGAQQVVTMLSMFACVQKDRNCKEAFRYFRLAADQGNEDAQFRVGECLDNGEGVAKDCAEALRYYRLSGNQGHVRALCAQGRLLEQGDIGVSQDYAEAAHAYNLAAEAGDEESMCALGEILEKGLGGVKQDRNEAIRLYKMCKGEFEYFALKALRQLCPSSDEAGNHENSPPSL